MIVAELVDGPGFAAVPAPFVDASFDASVDESVLASPASVFALEVDFLTGFFGAVQAVPSALFAAVLVVPLSDLVSDSGVPLATHAAKLALSCAATVSFGGIVSSSRLFSESFAAARALL